MTFKQVRQSFFAGLNRAANWMYLKGEVLAVGIVLCGMVATFIIAEPALQFELGEISKDRLTAIQTLLVTVGGSLIGATAIVSAMVVYALQVNVERMPHELFRRLSADLRILLIFIGTFSLATLIAALSTLVTQQNTVFALLIAFWSLVFILILYAYAYRRTIDLVSPNYQLSFIHNSVKIDLSRWAKRAEKFSRREDQLATGEAEKESPPSSFDVGRLAFYQQFQHWTRRTDEALFYALSFAARYADKRDFAVVNASYQTVLSIHSCYIKAKGNTFVAANGFIDSPLSGDALLSDTLETLRQIHREAVSRGNERQIVSNLQVMANLAQLYLQIDYGSPYARSKTHANLAAHYLADSIKEVVPHNFPDVLMQGIRLLGKQARLCLVSENKDEISTLSEKISNTALVGIARQDHVPVTICAVEELAKITIALLQSSGKRNLRFPLHSVRRTLHQLALLVIQHTKADAIRSQHSQALAGYYSATSPTAFSGLLTELTNQLINAKPDNEVAQQIIRNIKNWSDQLYVSQKELLLATVSAKSQFTFDIIYWIVQVTKLLAILSEADVCPPHIQKELRKDANWLIVTLSWIPDDEETVRHLENFRIGDVLFRCTTELYAYECFDIAETTTGLLVSWAFRAGRYLNGWDTLEHTLYGVAALSLKPELQSNTSIEEIAGYLKKYEIPQDLLNRAARNMRSTAQNPFLDHGHSEIERALASEDPEKFAATLVAMANVLSPSTAN